MSYVLLSIAKYTCPFQIHQVHTLWLDPLMDPILNLPNSNLKNSARTFQASIQSRSQRPRSFWSAPRIVTSVRAISFPEPTCLLVSTKTRSSGITNYYFLEVPVSRRMRALVYMASTGLKANKMYQQATGTMILLVYVGSISNRLHKCNEENRGRNRHIVVECFLRRCTVSLRRLPPSTFSP